MNSIVVAAFYQFAPLPDAASVQPLLHALLLEHRVKGTVLLAPEGVNGTISGERPAIDAALFFLRALPGFEALEHKESFYSAHPFGRLKVKLKREIIGIGAPADPTQRVGTYVEPEDWNRVLKLGIPVIDTRNDYEVEHGSFAEAINPGVSCFKEMPRWTAQNIDPSRHKQVAMFCTGGIRCEKYSSYLLSQGVEEVLHLRGGILKYLETVPEEESLWHGRCFVFDERVALGHGLDAEGEDDTP